ncbi:uncharacterized protein LOC116031614 [Ipomoea triloba]|uniref:uncharacterized protein LOC116031614 n=1 Tax=Ipomoea triloba TaxID=35885 RepID=UPI00125D7713|nr:uncharacterized protein LOC116031614 [Ipomoea triloba]
MAASSRRSTGPILRSLSPAGRLYSSSKKTSSFSSSASAFASSTSGFAARSSNILRRPMSPTRVNVYTTRNSTPASSVRFSLDRPISPSRSISVVNRDRVMEKAGSGGRKRTCMCSPTTHPGSFRCSLHKNMNVSGAGHAPAASAYNSHRLNMRRSAMTNSLVRIGTVEGDLVKRALGALIRPSSHHQRRRAGFQPGPSRLSVMSKA